MIARLVKSDGRGVLPERAVVHVSRGAMALACFPNGPWCASREVRWPWRASRTGQWCMSREVRWPWRASRTGRGVRPTMSEARRATRTGSGESPVRCGVPAHFRNASDPRRGVRRHDSGQRLPHLTPQAPSATSHETLNGACGTLAPSCGACDTQAPRLTASCGACGAQAPISSTRGRHGYADMRDGTSRSLPGSSGDRGDSFAICLDYARMRYIVRSNDWTDGKDECDGALDH